MKLLLLGATGLVGSQTLKLALSHGAVSKVIAPTRTALPPSDKLANPLGERLEELIPAMMSHQPDAVICALGTTIAKAGSKGAFRHVDHELPVTIGKAAYAVGVETFSIVTAMGASPKALSFYSRTKGDVERDIQAIGFRSLTICRPSLIGGHREEKRFAEGVGLALFRLLEPIIPKNLRINPADVIAASLLNSVIVAKPGCNWIFAREMH